MNKVAIVLMIFVLMPMFTFGQGTIDKDEKQSNELVEKISVRGFAITSKDGTPLIILDGKTISKEEFNKIDPGTIESFSVLKGNNATDLYGEQAKNGVVIYSSEGVNLCLEEKIIQCLRIEVRTDVLRMPSSCRLLL